MRSNRLFASEAIRTLPMYPPSASSRRTQGPPRRYPTACDPRLPTLGLSQSIPCDPRLPSQTLSLPVSTLCQGLTLSAFFAVVLWVQRRLRRLVCFLAAALVLVPVHWRLAVLAVEVPLVTLVANLSRTLSLLGRTRCQS